MTSTQVLPVISSGIILTFAVLVFRRSIKRGGLHLVLWGIGLAMFGVASLAEAYSAVAWHPMAFRLWYLAGAMLNAAWLGQGTVYLLREEYLPNVLVSLALGYALAAGTVDVLSRLLGLAPAVQGGLVALAGLAGTFALLRRWGYHWAPRRLATGLTVLLIAGTVIATYLVFTTPLDAARFDIHQTLSAQYRELLPPGAIVRSLTPIFNIYRLLSLVGGALYSAWLLRRKETLFHRVMGNLFIALGALSLAFASTLVRFGLGDYLYLGELSAAMLMFAGFVLVTTKAPASHAPRQRVMAS